jgi:hypothetical protein
MQTQTDIAMNVNRLEQSVCEIRSESLRIDSRAAANIKIKRNLKKKGFIGSRTVVLLMKCVQVQKMRTTLWHKFFYYLPLKNGKSKKGLYNIKLALDTNAKSLWTKFVRIRTELL